MSNNSLLARFKKQFEEGTDFKVFWSNLDKEGNLTVGIVDSEGKDKGWLHVVEKDNGEIYWY